MRGFCSGRTNWVIGLVIVACAAAGSLEALAGTIYVSKSGADANTGQTWGTAKKTVAAALNTAVSGDQVWVSAGTYVERIAMTNGVALYGGFAGGESSLGQRNLALNVTILDGNAGGNVVRVSMGATTTTRIDGLTIRNGNANASGGARNGGGIYCFSTATPTIANNTITGNVADLGGGIYCTSAAAVIVNNAILVNGANTMGGGIYCSGNSPLIVNNTIAWNSAPTGGGIYCLTASPTVANNIVAHNSSGIFGLAGAPNLQNNCVYNPVGYNYSGLSAGATDISLDPGLQAAAYGQFRLIPGSPCLDSGRDSAVQSGWLDVDGEPRVYGAHVDIGADEYNGSPPPQFSPVIVRVDPSGDDALDGSNWAAAKRTVQAAINTVANTGGEVWVARGTYAERIVLPPRVYAYGGFAGDETARDQRNWKGNVTLLDGGAGGSVVKASAGHQLSGIDGFTIRNGKASSGGGIQCINSGPTIANNMLIGNLATGSGGAISCSSGSPVISNNTIRGNTGGSFGGGIFCTGASPIISTCVILANNANFGGGIYCGNASSPVVVNSTVIENGAGSGGGIYCSGTSTAPTVSNNILAFNSSGIGKDASAAPVLRNNCVHNPGGANYVDVSPGAGDITADPLLRAEGYGEVHLTAGSPCINTGLASAVGSDWVDMDGEARVQQGHVDMGADEFNGTSPPPFTPVIVRVSPAGDDAHEGSSWTSAKLTVQAAIDVAAEVGGEVWVAAGTYYERLKLRPWVGLYGGFAGTETGRDERNWELNPTILDGDRMGPVITVLGGHRVNRIDGFVIQNGMTVSDSAGGIHCANASPTIANNTIIGNTGHCWGGGIYCTGTAPQIFDNLIAQNEMDRLCDASYGGGIYCGSGSPMIWNNTIRGNMVATSAGLGGGIYCASGSPVIWNNTIAGNFGGKSGGGIYCSGTPTITNNTITSNTACGNGGGIYAMLTPTISNNIVAFNSTGIYRAGNGTATLRNNCVYNPLGYNYSGLNPGGGDISVDPQLVAIDFGQVHLRSGSPCIDTGLDSSVQAEWADLDGEARIQGGHVDIGADEFNGTVPTFVPVVIRVWPNGDDAHDGQAWASAKRTVQAGIEAAALTGGEVWVASGTYPEGIVMKPWVHVYGGFAGTENDRAERDWRSHTTILDGGGGSVVNALRIPVCSLDGFTVRNGGGVSISAGGGVYCAYSALRIANNTITGNRSSFYGGGIYCYQASADIANNTISGNLASSVGGGIYASYSTLLIANNLIIGQSKGGGIYCETDTRSTIINNTMVHNHESAVRGGSSGEISNNIVAFNSSGISAAGGTSMLHNNCIYNPGGSSSSGASDILVDPQLSGREYGQVHLTSTSPCIDAGLDGSVQAGWLDMDGQARVQGAHVDIGADEFNATSPPPFTPTIVRVSSVGDDASDGSSWSQAKRTVQAGIDAATISGGEVWVAAGTYHECITLKAWTHVYGGFAGAEVNREQRDWRTNVTTLDGDYSGSVVTAPPGSSVCTLSGFTIRRGTGTPVNEQLRGGGICCAYSLPSITFNTITNNVASVGGGIYCDDAPALIANNTILANGGGGIACSSNAGRILNNTIVANNGDYYSGGISCMSGSPTIANNIIAFNTSGLYSSGSPVVRANCVYNPAGANFSGGFGTLTGNITVDPQLLSLAYGQVHLAVGSPCIDAGDDTVIQSGWQDVDGEPRLQGTHVDIGADEFSGVTPPFTPVVIRVSTTGDDAQDGLSWATAKLTVQAGIDAAAVQGGEVWVAGGTYLERIVLSARTYVYGGFAGTESRREDRNWGTNETVMDGDSSGSVVSALAGYRVSGVDGFVIRNGTGQLSSGSHLGGGIYCAASPIILNARILGNSAQYGAGVYCAGSSPLIVNTAIAGNIASSGGGGVGGVGARPQLINCTLSGNTAPTGAGMYSTSGSPSLTNCVLWGNGGSEANGTGWDVTHSDVRGGYAGAGNINSDPRFARNPNPGADNTWGTEDDDYGELRLLAGSPGIDAGKNSAVMAGVVVDLDGHGRFYNDPATPDCQWSPGTCGTAPIVDMGAYEFIAGDYDRDGDLDMSDVAGFVACMSGSSVMYAGDCMKADLDRDGDVDLVDYGVFQRCYSGAAKSVEPGCGV